MKKKETGKNLDSTWWLYTVYILNTYNIIMQ